VTGRSPLKKRRSALDCWAIEGGGGGGADVLNFVYMYCRSMYSRIMAEAVAGLSPRRPGFSPTSVPVRFMVVKVVLGQVFPSSNSVCSCQDYYNNASYFSSFTWTGEAWKPQKALHFWKWDIVG